MQNYETKFSLSSWKSSAKKESSAWSAHPTYWRKVRWSFVVQKTFQELYSTTMLQHSVKELKQMGTYFKTQIQQEKNKNKKNKSTEWLHIPCLAYLKSSDAQWSQIDLKRQCVITLLAKVNILAHKINKLSISRLHRPRISQMSSMEPFDCFVSFCLFFFFF